MGTETFLRVGIDGTGAESGERVVVRSLGAISLSAGSAAQSVDNLEKKIGGCGNRAPDASKVVKRSLLEIAESAEVAGVSVSTLENMFVRLAARTVMIAGIYKTIGSIKSAVTESLQYLGQIETSGLSIAASFLAGGEYIDSITKQARAGSSALRAAQQDSANVIEQLRVANLKTSATLDQLIYAYQVTLPEAQAKAFNRKQIMDYTLAMVQAAGAIGLPYAQIAEETRDMLKGAVNSRNTRIATILGMGPQNAEYMAAVRKGGDTLYDYLMKRLTGFRLAGEETQKTWAGLWSNLSDVGKIGGGIAVEPIFQGIKKVLKEIQDYVITIDKATGNITINPEFKKEAKEAGELLNDMFHGVVNGTKFLIEHREAILTVVEAYAAYRAAVLASSLANKAMETDLAKSVVLASRVAQGKAMYIDSPSSNVLRTKEGVDKAQDALAAAAAQRDYAKATEEAMKADKLLATSRATNLESASKELASDIKAREEKLKYVSARLAERREILADIKAKMEENAVNSLPLTNRTHGVFTKEQYQAQKEFLALKQEQAAVSRTVAEWETRESKVMADLSDSIVRQNTVSSKLTKARELQTITETRYVAAVDQTATAQKAVTAAEEAAALAGEAHAASLAKATLGSRALAVASGILDGAMKALNVTTGFLFGTLEGLVVVVGSLYWALSKLYHLQETKNNSLAKMGNESAFGELAERERKAKEEIKKLQEKDATPEQKRLTAMQEFDKKLVDYRKEESSLIGQITKLQGKLIQWRDSDTGLTELETKQAELRNVQNMIRNGRAQLQDTLDAEAKRDSLSTYKAKPPKSPTDTTTADRMAQVKKQLSDSWLAYDKAFTDRQLNAEKNATKNLLEEVNNRHTLQLSSEKQFIDAKAALAEKGLNSEMDTLEKRKNKLLDKLKELGVSKESALDPNNERNQPEFSMKYMPTGKNHTQSAALTAIKEELELRTKLQEVLKEENKLQTELHTNSETAKTATLKNVKEMADAYAELSASLKAMRGDSVGAVKEVEEHKQAELQKRITALASAGPMDKDSAAEVNNLYLQIEQSAGKIAQSVYDQLKAQTELKAQLLEQAGLYGEAEALRNSIVPMDPARLGLNPVNKALQDMINKLKEVAQKFSELHRNDVLKFKIEDTGVDQFTKREREIRREYENTKEFKLNQLNELMKNEEANGKQIKEIQEDLNLNEQNRTVQTTQLKKDMASSYLTFASNAATQLASTMDTTSKSQFEAAKALNMAAVVMNTATAIMAQLTTPGAAGWAMAAATAALGAVQIAKIASTKYGSSGSVSFTDGSAAYQQSDTGTAVSGVGSSMSSPTYSIHDSLANDALQSLATAAENASVALDKISNGLTDISDAFTEGGRLDLATQSGSAPNSATEVDKPGWWSDIRDGLFGSTGKWTGLSDLVTGMPVLGLQNQLNTFWSKTFGIGNKWYTKDAGTVLYMTDGEVGSTNYTTYKKDGSLFSSSKTKTEYTEGDSGFEATLQKYVDQVISTVNRSAAVMGTSTNTSLLDMGPVTISTAGKTTDEIQDSITDWLTDVGNAASKTIPELEKFTFYGESSFDAVVRLSTALQEANLGFQKIGVTLMDSSIKNADKAYQLIDLFGGNDEFTDAIDTYIKSVYTDAEQDRIQKESDYRSLTTSFNEMHAAYSDFSATVPATRDEFISLVQSLDLTTSEGQALFNSLMNVSETFGDWVGLTEDLDDTLGSFLDDLTERLYTAEGLNYTASLYKLLAEQEDELTTAREDGMDVTQLWVVQQEEYAAQLASIYKDAADDAIEIQTSLLSGLTGIIKSTLTPYQKYKADLEDWETTKNLAYSGNTQAQKDLAEKGQAFLESSKAYNATNAQYQQDYAEVVANLADLAGLDTISPTLEVAQNQLTTLQDIQTALDDGNKSQLEYLRGMLNNTGLTAKYLDGYLSTLPGNGTQTAGEAITSLSSYAVGSSGLPSDGPIYAHQGEIVMDAASSRILQTYGIQVQAASNYTEETNAHLEASVRVMQAGFTRLIELTEQQAEDIAELKRKTRQEKARN